MAPFSSFLNMLLFFPLSAYLMKLFFLLLLLATPPADSFSTSSSSSITVNGSAPNIYGKIQSYFDGFELDEWQLQAGQELIGNGSNVVVCAPTGAGKTVVGEIALHHAFEKGKHAIYTTPLKALSNQKFFELRKIFGAENVGLSTGDTSINRGAKITVMTTEVYRNLAWKATASASESNFEDKDYNLGVDLSQNEVVVFDEFHYMGQPGRGSVWEESVIFNPSHTKIVALSATLPNGNNIAEWIESSTLQSTALIEAGTMRPVPLRYFFASSDGVSSLFQDPDAGPGSPKGLLGLRGDGIAPPLRLNKKSNRGFNAKNSDESLENKRNELPRGLSLNSAIRKATTQQMNRVEKAIAKRKLVDEDKSRRERFKKKDEFDFRGRRTFSPRDERRERERQVRSEMRKAVPSLPFLLRKLRQKELLPAIFFIFSRKGCDDAAENICNNFMGLSKGNGMMKTASTRRRSLKRSKTNDNLLEDDEGRKFRSEPSSIVSDENIASIADDTSVFDMQKLIETGGSIFSEENLEKIAERGLLSLGEVKEAAARIISFNEQNSEIPIQDGKAVQLMLGVGSHHAGMLPAHKTLVEVLFRGQLVKVVFATETLAAGINMPARTTVICSIAKRNDDGMGLLRTSNLLQMAGRAGRRGMDIAGNCVIVATPFETADDASTILLNEVEAIESQFSPTYSLAVNLVERGGGRLDLARQLIEKSFAVFMKRQREQMSIENIAVGKDSHTSGVLLDYIFFEVLRKILADRYYMAQSYFQEDNNEELIWIEDILPVLSSEQQLKKMSKSYVALQRILDLETKTMKYLEVEEHESVDMYKQLGVGDPQAEYINEQILVQRGRINQTKEAMDDHYFTKLASLTNKILKEQSEASTSLQIALSRTRSDRNKLFSGDIEAAEIVEYAKSISAKSSRKTIKMFKKERGNDDSNNDYESASSDKDNAWSDMLVTVDVLEAFGCLKNVESSYELTPAGENLGSLNFDNSLWITSAVGGAWDIGYLSSDIDSFRDAFDDFDKFLNDDTGSINFDVNKSSKPLNHRPQEEAEVHLANLLALSPSEMAGFISCLVADESRNSDLNTMDHFKELSPNQRAVIESAALSAERLLSVQGKLLNDDSSITAGCRLELGVCQLVTQWAEGASWNELMESSQQQAPGDLVRTLQRALDALRQIGSVEYNPVRSFDMCTKSKSCPGVHPDIRKTCRDAARLMDRYPVRDLLTFGEEGVDDVEEEDSLDLDDTFVDDDQDSSERETIITDNET